MTDQNPYDNPDRPQDALTPIVDRRSPRQLVIPEWRRRALEQRDRLGNVAVADLTDAA